MRHLTVSFGGGRLPATAHAMSLFCSWLCAVRLCCDRVFPFRLFLSLLPCSLVVVWHPLSDPQCLSLLAAIVPLVAVPAPCASHIQPSTASHRSRSTSSGRSNSLAMCSSRALRNLRICAERDVWTQAACLGNGAELLLITLALQSMAQWRSC